MNNFRSSFGSSPFSSDSLDEYKKNREMNEQPKELGNNLSEWGFSSRFSNSLSDGLSPFQRLRERRFGDNSSEFRSNNQPKSPFGRLMLSNDSPFTQNQWTNTSRFMNNNGRINSPFENSSMRSPFGGQSFSNGKYVSPFRNLVNNFGTSRTNGYGPQFNNSQMMGNPNFGNQPYNPYGSQPQYPQAGQQQPYDPYGTQPQYPQAGQQQPAYDPYATQPQYPQAGQQQPAYDPYATQPQYPPQTEQQPVEQQYSDPYAAQEPYAEEPYAEAPYAEEAYAEEPYAEESYSGSVADSIASEIGEGDSKSKHALFVWSAETNDWDLVGNFKNLKKAESKKKKMMASKKHDYSDEWFSISPL